jgi:RNA polymerase sigma-70 factor (ECF subfamily)
MTSTAAAALDLETSRWLRALGAGGAEREAAYARLHARLLRTVYGELHRRGAASRIGGPELDELAHEAAADALVSIRRRLPEFRGESRFTTWAYKFAIFEVSAKLGRHYRRARPVSLDAEDWDRLPDNFNLDPSRRNEWRELVSALSEAVDTSLSEHQRRVFAAIVLNAVPLDALVQELGSNRNAIYKTLYDVRRKLRARLAAEGHLTGDE